MKFQDSDSMNSPKTQFVGLSEDAIHSKVTSLQSFRVFIQFAAILLQTASSICSALSVVLDSRALSIATCVCQIVVLAAVKMDKHVKTMARDLIRSIE